MIYLLLLSFIIHAITFVMIKQLKINQDQQTANKEALDQQQKEIEELLAVYLIELREENEKLIKLINKGNQTDAMKVSKKKEAVVQPESTSNHTEEKYVEFQPITPELEEDIVEQSFAAQVLSLSDKGESAESIAKKLNRGKTEVELLIKFHQK